MCKEEKHINEYPLRSFVLIHENKEKTLHKKHQQIQIITLEQTLIFSYIDSNREAYKEDKKLVDTHNNMKEESNFFISKI